MHISAESTAAATKKRENQLDEANNFMELFCSIWSSPISLVCIISMEISSRTHDLKRNELAGTMEMGFQCEKIEDYIILQKPLVLYLITYL